MNPVLDAGYAMLIDSAPLTDLILNESTAVLRHVLTLSVAFCMGIYFVPAT
jgi:hypothetical protein